MAGVRLTVSGGIPGGSSREIEKEERKYMVGLVDGDGDDGGLGRGTA